MALNTFKCNYVTPLQFKGLKLYGFSFQLSCYNNDSPNWRRNLHRNYCVCRLTFSAVVRATRRTSVVVRAASRTADSKRTRWRSVGS